MSGDPIVIKKAVDNLSCLICRELFKDAKFLPCHHSYCVKCLGKMVIQSTITCPECRCEAVVPKEGVEKLPNNILINRLVDELILKRKVQGEEEVNCEECVTGDPVVSFCSDCTIFYCHMCSEAHKRTKRYCEHNVISLYELQTKKDVQIQQKPKPLMCTKHDTHVLTLFCETCEVLICDYCALKKEEHFDHVHDTVKTMAIKHRNSLREIAVKGDEILSDLCRIHDHIEIAIKRIKKQGDDFITDIDQVYDDLIQNLIKQRDLVKQEVHDAVSQKEKIVTAQLEEVELLQADVVAVKDLFDAVQKGSDQEALSTKKQVTDRMLKLSDKHKALNTEPLESDTMHLVFHNISLPIFSQLFVNVDPTNSEIDQIPERICRNVKTELKIFSKFSSGHQCLRGGSRVSVQLESSTGNVFDAEVIDNDDGSYTASFEAPEVGETKVSAYINDEQIRGSPNVIMVNNNYPGIKRPTKIIDNNKQMGFPWGIACGLNGLWAVADHTNYCVYIYDGQDQLLRRFGTRGNKIDQFSSLYGITFDTDKNLYMADYTKNRILKFDIDGNHLLTFGKKGKGNGELSNPIGVTTHNGRVYVADANNNRISVFSTNGEFCLHFGSDHLDTPYDLVVNCNSHLLVVDYGKNCVYTFTLTGDFINKFGAQGHHGQLNHPCSITTDNNGCMLVVDTGNYRVVVFDKDRNFLHSFGAKGCGNGQFFDHHGIAINSDGNIIYVSDNRNRRIQVYCL
ncbi:tripartite motif-containing protein 2-like [Dysidea avara]|uniref:tripartite motif-containing protein 2-like n=1 Tax=Dysidea avara TaxID=196820 RepID=UPI00332403F7